MDMGSWFGKARDVNEQRESIRVRSFLRGEIIHSHGASRTECTIRDLSDTGARLDAPPSVTIPEFFELIIPARSLHKRGQIVWRHGAEIGVRFVDERTNAQPEKRAEGQGEDIATRIVQLEAETARLRAQLMEMKAVLHEILQSRKFG